MRAALIFLLLLTPAAAQTQTGHREAFAAYTQTKGYVAALTKALQVADGRNRPFCEKRKIVRAQDFRVERLAISKKTGKPVAGYWGELVTVRGCEAPLSYRVWFFLGRTKPLFAFAAVPGETRADAFQMRLAMRQVFQVTKQVVTGCDTVRFGAAKLVPGGSERIWAETWTAHTCGIPRRFRVMFEQQSDDTRKTAVRAQIEQ
jgi:hypothetical protein